MARWQTFLIAVSLSFGCGDEDTPTDGAPPDGGMDSSPRDASADVATPDTATADATIADTAMDSTPPADTSSPVDAMTMTWPPGSTCNEGTASPTCADGVAEATCGDQVVFFSQRALDEADAYWSVPKPAGGFRLAGRYARGHAYLRLQVFSKPSAIDVFPQVCFWRWDPDNACGARWSGFAETCATRRYGYAATGTYYIDLGAPVDWWQRASPAWSYGRPFDEMRIMHFADYMGEKRLLKDSRCGSACWPVAGGAAAHMPIDAEGELVVVAEGASLVLPASWSDCGETWCP